MARTTNEFGGGEIVPAIEAITGIQAPVMADFTEIVFSTVFNEHGERRQIQNLRNNLKSSSGIERIPFNGIDELDTEQGPNGATVYALNTGDSRIRFVGRGWDIVSEANPATNLRTPSTTDYVEITFFGTGLNILTITNSGPRTIIPVVDGVTGTDIYPGAFNDILEGRNTKTNQVLPVTSGLTPGVHTIRLSQTNASSGTPFSLYGCEIINENAGITQQPGADFDGRVSSLDGGTFPIEPDNTTVPSINSTTSVVEGYGTRTRGARVLNYLTSGGQYKQSFVPVVTKTLSYEAVQDAAAAVTWTIPTGVTSFNVRVVGSGGAGGNGRSNNNSNSGAEQNFGYAGAGGGSGAYYSADYAITSGTTNRLRITVGAGGTAASGNGLTGGTGVTTLLEASINSGTNFNNLVSVTGGGGGEGGLSSSNTVPADGGAASAVTASTVTGFTASSASNIVGAAGTNGGIGGGFPSQQGTCQFASGGAGADAANNTVDNLGGTGIGGSGGIVTTSTNTPATGGAPFGSGGGGGAARNAGCSSEFNEAGIAGQAARIIITFTAAGGLGTQGVNFREVLDRSDEEIVRRINFREFGANNNFATLGSSSTDVAFTLDDGTTTLVGNDVDTSITSFVNGIDAIALSETADFVTLTFVGTGLDIFGARQTSDTVAASINVEVDGFSVGNLTTLPTNFIGIIPIVSGLAYGTHTVKFQNTTARNFGIADFIIYGPKKPEIPTLDAGSLELSDYNVVADYAPTTSNAYGRRSSGVLGKTSFREFLYSGAVEIQNHLLTVLMPFGRVVEVHTESTGYFEYTFYGTGIELYASTVNESDTSPNTITLDSVALGTTGTVVPIASAYDTSTSIWSRTAGTNVPGQLYTLVPYILQVSGLPLGVHTIRATRTATDNGSTGVDGAFIITPIHINDDTLKIGSEGLNNLTIDPVVEEDEAVVQANLGEAKAWINYSTAAGQGGSDPTSTVVSSLNISAIIEVTSGTDFRIFFDRPFKDTSYVVLATGQDDDTGTDIKYIQAFNSATVPKGQGFIRLVANGAVSNVFAAFYGELIDE